jgi:outer membrane lipoprotein-sorting protein
MINRKPRLRYTKSSWIAVVVVMLSFMTTSLRASEGPTPTQAERSPGQTTASTLEGVLSQMDAAAAQFRSASADFVWEQYQKVVNETDTQKGKIYFRRDAKGKDTEMAADIQSPEQKYLLFSGGKIQFYQPKISQVNEYSAGKNRAEVESFLVLGFGGSGHDLQQQFEIKFDGNEDVDGVKTAKLELTPKAPRVKNMFEKIILWLDAPRGISLKQQAFEPSGDYRLAHYSNIKVNAKIPDEVFKLHTSGHTKTVKGT